MSGPAVSKVNPLTYEVEALRSLLVGTTTNQRLDLIVLVGATVAGITASSLLFPARRGETPANGTRQR